MKRFADLEESEKNDWCIEYPGHWFSYLPGSKPFDESQSTLELWMTGPYDSEETARSREGVCVVVWISSADDPRMSLPVMSDKEAEKKNLNWKQYREQMFPQRRKYYY